MTGCGLTFPTALPILVSGVVVCECPQVYPDETAAEVTRIVSLSRKVGRVEQFYEMHGCKVHLFLPREWKGQVPKDIHQKRTEAALSNYETAMVNHALVTIAAGKQHNVWDAIALGRWFLKKEGVRREA